jgi:transcriptional regulator with XRE-family HTH domain
MEGGRMALAERMTRLRVGKEESLQDVATSVGVSKAHIWELEKGRADNPSMALVTRLSNHFGVSVAYMMGEDASADDADVELARMFRQAQELDDSDRALLDQLLQGFLNRRRGVR